MQVKEKSDMTSGYFLTESVYYVYKGRSTVLYTTGPRDCIPARMMQLQRVE